MATASVNVESLKDVFKCFICIQKLNDARLCPHCSKLCCYQCIRRWILEQRPQCPHCRAALRLRDLVKCRWVEEVTQRLETLDNSPSATSEDTTRRVSDTENRCSEHNEKLSVFCWTCQSCICHACALWGGQHSGHTLKPLEDEYTQRVAQISQEVIKLRRRLCSLITNLQELEKNMEEIRNAKEERTREIRCAVELMIARLDSQMKSKLVSLTGQKRSLSMEVEMVESVLSEVDQQLSGASHAHLVHSSTELFRMLAQLQRNHPPDRVHVAADFHSELVPEYELRQFVLRPFSELRARADPVYSSVLCVNGLSWRLKVYPDGNGVVRGNYLSVFLELSSGAAEHEQAKYEYLVEMLHQRSVVDAADEEQAATSPTAGTGRNIVREFASEFEIGECWGYNRFFKLESLSQDGFLNERDDSLVLRFQVRPPSYYQKCKDLACYIKQLEGDRRRHLSRISEMEHQNMQQMHEEGMARESLLLEDDEQDHLNDRPVEGWLIDIVEPPVSYPLSAVDGGAGVVTIGSSSICEGGVVTTTTPSNNALIRVDGDVVEAAEETASERDVEDHSLRMLDNDVEEEMAAVGGLADELNRITLSLPDRETSDLVREVNHRRHFDKTTAISTRSVPSDGGSVRYGNDIATSDHDDSSSDPNVAENTVNRIREAFRSGQMTASGYHQRPAQRRSTSGVRQNINSSAASDARSRLVATLSLETTTTGNDNGGDQQHFHDWPLSSSVAHHVDCPACSPKSKKTLFRRLRSRHKDVATKDTPSTGGDSAVSSCSAVVGQSTLLSVSMPSSASSGVGALAVARYLSSDGDSDGNDGERTKDDNNSAPPSARTTTVRRKSPRQGNGAG